MSHHLHEKWPLGLQPFPCLHAFTSLNRFSASRFRTWALFLLQFLLQPNLLALYLRRPEQVAVSTKEPFGSSFPIPNPHLILSWWFPSTPLKATLGSALWASVHMKQEQHITYSVFPRIHTKFWEHMNCWHTSIEDLKKKIKKTEKKPQNQPQKPPEEVPAGQSTLISGSPGREVKVCDWLTLCLCLPGKQAVTAVLAVLQATKTCFIQGGFLVLYVLLLLTELTTQIGGSFC